MMAGERRFANRLESQLEDDYLCWYDVPVGAKQAHPDFIILNPRRGILVLEVKDWKLDTIISIDRTTATIRTDRGQTSVANPLEQARQYAHAVNRLLERDPALLGGPDAGVQGRLAFPWGYGVVLTNITRRQLENPIHEADLRNVLPAERVICQDEMTESVDKETFQRRLWGMFGVVFRFEMTLPQIDRVRWHLFPEIRVSAQQGALELGTKPTDTLADSIPDLIRVMDLQQEQLARSLGEGHRIIHGVAGSGKTMILGYRAQHLAQALGKPILLLCYNVSLAAKLAHVIEEKGLSEKVHVRSFHRWCVEQLRAFNVPKPSDSPEYWKALVEAVIAGVDKQQIPRAQYGAVLIDEGHDFEPEWLKLVVQMVDPDSNSVLVLYDDAQSLYGPRKRLGFSFSQVGIQARGRTTILGLNYRNTAEVLAVAYEFAREVLTPAEAEEDGIPLISPQSAGRHGAVPEILRFPSMSRELRFVVERLRAFHDAGIAWRDMAVIYRTEYMGKPVVERLEQVGIPVEWLGRSRAHRRFQPGDDSIKVMTMHSSKGLEFPVVIIPGLDQMPHPQEDEASEARLLYVAMTRAMNHLVLTHHADSLFADRVNEAVKKVA